MGKVRPYVRRSRGKGARFLGAGNPVVIASQLLVVKRLGDTGGVSLQCFTSGLPAPGYLLWSFQNQLAMNTTTTSPYSVSSLGTQLLSSMAGLYSCSVFTSAGNATAETIVEVNSELSGGWCGVVGWG